MLATVLIAFHVLGIASAASALMTARTPQGAIAWIATLVFVPYLALPAYWVFGQARFQGYVTARRHDTSALRQSHDWLPDALTAHPSDLPGSTGTLRASEALAAMPYLRGNRATLLVDGEATFEDLFAGLDAAEHYLLVQFYTVVDDGLGRALRERLVAAARRGVRVYFLYDAIGSYFTPRSFVEPLREAGVSVRRFRSSRGLGRFQINFRNHRKIVVADGRRAWAGGHNVADDYVNRGDRPWRDTHARLEGPAALALQLVFLEDWHWSTGETLDLAWTLPEEALADDGAPVLILPSGPADDLETASLMVQHFLAHAHERIWISSPYFVPDQATVHELQLAALRGVDVRVLLPHRADSLIVDLASHAAVPPVLAGGVRVWRYEAGFLHGKVFLIDDALAAISTVNLDNRSFRLNFEVTALVADEAFAREVEAMFEADFARSKEVEPGAFEARSLGFRIAARAAHLASPVL